MSALDKIDYDLLAKQTNFLLNYPWREGTMPKEINGLLDLIDLIFDDYHSRGNINTTGVAIPDDLEWN